MNNEQEPTPAYISDDITVGQLKRWINDAVFDYKVDNEAEEKARISKLVELGKAINEATFLYRTIKRQF